MRTTYPSNTISSNNRVNLTAGAIGGLIAGAVMILCHMIYTASIGQGFFAPLEAIGATFYGPDAFLGGAGPVITGLLIHTIASASLGALFASVLNYGSSVGRAVGVGAAFGVAVWAVMTFVVLNLVNETMRSYVAQMPGVWFMVHLVFGATLGCVPPLRKSLSRSHYVDPRSTDYLDRAA